MNILFGYTILNFFVSIRNEFLNKLFILITDLGSLEFYLILISFLFFIFDDRKTIKILFLLMISYLINSLLKNIFKFPRPDENIVKPVYKESGGGYGFPSGHSQNSLVLWLGLFYIFKKNYLKIVSIILIILISISRLYLGLHFLFDVLGGILIGLIILFLYFNCIDRFFEKFFYLNLKKILLISFSLIIISLFIKEYSFILISLSGILIGINLSKEFNQTYLNMKKIVLRIFVGYPVIFILIYIIKITNFNFIYFFLGLWVTYLSRLIFKKICI
ncbi:MAG: phosphatase PAP2 family protein [Caldisericia bacterium]